MITNSPGERGSVFVSVLLGLGLLYLLITFFSLRGCGYPGYYGYRSPGSFWYMGGVPTYHDRGFRTGGAGGVSRRGGGFGGGK